MRLVEPADRDVLATLLRRNAPAHVYELGDLDDFDWSHTRWFGLERDGVLEEVVLLYTQPAVPILIAIANDPPEPMVELLEAAVSELPTPLYAHASADLLPVLARRYEIEDATPHLKLTLADLEQPAIQALPAEILGVDDLEQISRLYDAAYPGTWFDPRMLATHRYVGVRRDGHLLCIAGVHVYSPTWGVAALGNVATHPRARGEGLARGACAALCRLLLADGIETISLNVRADNTAAIRAYSRLGFEPVAEYTEASLR